MDYLESAEERMQKTLDNLNDEFVTIRAGRANPGVLNRVTVDYYGVPTPIQQMANVSVPEARILLIQGAWILLLTGLGVWLWKRHQQRIVLQGG